MRDSLSTTSLRFSASFSRHHATLSAAITLVFLCLLRVLGLQRVLRVVEALALLEQLLLELRCFLRVVLADQTGIVRSSSRCGSARKAASMALGILIFAPCARSQKSRTNFGWLPNRLAGAIIGRRERVPGRFMKARSIDELGQRALGLLAGSPYAFIPLIVHKSPARDPSVRYEYGM